jgi:hypothetical protein
MSRVSGGIFISYRRQDAAHAGRLSDALAQRYGKANVVFDVDTIAPGASFETQLHDAVRSSAVLIAVVGPGWLTATGAGGRRRIDDPGDFVRREIADAIAQRKRLIPVLVGDAWLPSEDQLPPDIATLTRWNAIQLRDDYYREGLDQLFRALDQTLPAVASRPPAPSAAPAPAPAPMPTPAKPAATLSFSQRVRMAIVILLGGMPPTPPATDQSALPPQVRAVPSGGALPCVFLSYSSTDVQLLEQVVRALEHAGYPCWYAPRDIPPSSPNWPRAIVEAIARSRLMVILVTKKSMESEQVLREVTIAADEKVPLLPFSVERVPLPPDFKYFFSLGQRLEVTGVSTGQAIQQLQSSVATRLAVAT